MPKRLYWTGVGQERKHRGRFFPPEWLCTLVVLQRLHSPPELNYCLWKSHPYGCMKFLISNIRSNIYMYGKKEPYCQEHA